MKDKATKKKSSGKFIFRASITLKDGTKLFAKNYGLRAFKIYIG